MKKILSYILIFVVVFVNLFAPFSVGTDYKNKINIANAEEVNDWSYTANIRGTVIPYGGEYSYNECQEQRNKQIQALGGNSDGFGICTSESGQVAPGGTVVPEADPAATDYFFTTTTPRGGSQDSTPTTLQECNEEREKKSKELGDAGQVSECKSRKVVQQILQNIKTEQNKDIKNTSDTEMPLCTFTDNFIKGTIAGCFAQIIYYVVFVPTSYLFALSGIFFDNTFAYSVQDTSYRSPFITEGWGLIRDFCNMFFIFILLYTAISTILDLHSAHTAQTIKRIIIIGLFINFSLFVTQVIIDASNVTARVFYNADTIKITEGGNTGASGVVDKADSKGVISLSAGLVNKVNPQNIIINSKNVGNVKPKNSDVNFTNVDSSEGSIGAGTFIVVTLLAAIINIVGIVVFVSVGLIFVSRIVGLWIAMIVSPLAFFTYIVPSMNGWNTVGWKNWWSDLLKMSFLAPVFIFFLYIILKFLEIDLWGGIQGSSGIASVIAVFLPFAFIMVLLMKAKDIAIKMSGEMGQKVAGLVEKVGATGGAFALGAATGGMAMLGRNTLGALGSRVANSKMFANAEAGNNLLGKTALGRWGAKMALKGGDKLQSSSFDARATGAGKALAKGIGATGGVDIIKVNKGGYKAIETNKEAARTQRAEELKTILNKDNVKNKRKADVDKKMFENEYSRDIHTVDKDIEAARQKKVDVKGKGEQAEKNAQADLDRLLELKTNISTGGRRAKMNEHGFEKDKDGNFIYEEDKYYTTNGNISENGHKKAIEKEGEAQKNVDENVTKLNEAEAKIISETIRAEDEMNNEMNSALADRTDAMNVAMENERKEIEEFEREKIRLMSIAPDATTRFNIDREFSDKVKNAQNKRANSISTAEADYIAKKNNAIEKKNQIIDDANNERTKAQDNLNESTLALSKATLEANKARTSASQDGGFGNSLKKLKEKSEHLEHDIEHTANNVADSYAEMLTSSSNRFANVLMGRFNEGAALEKSAEMIRLDMKTKSVDVHAAPIAGGGHGGGGHGGGDKHDTHGGGGGDSHKDSHDTHGSGGGDHSKH